MAATLIHRGPDEEGAFLSTDGRCAIGFRRLAIIDPERSQQPMTSPDDRLTVAFNGEIYNFRQLRETLSADGALFRTGGDTEVLLHLYDRYGAELVHHLMGMFAFILYDATKGDLLLCRDRFGQKPLWYSILPDRIVFASEAKALFVHPRIERSIDLHSIQYFLTMGYIPAPRSIWRNIRKLCPANYLRCSDGASGPRQYWSPQVTEISDNRDEIIHRVRHEIERSVEARMVSDVPLGALLSGGVDSSIVVALMCKIAGATGGIRTFTAGFEDGAYDERPSARLVSDHCHTEHTELLIRPAASQSLERMVEMFDEPFADSSAIPTFLISQAAREHVTVALVGDGGDEIFAGYDRHRAMHLTTTLSPAACMAIRLAAFVARPLAPHNEHSKMRRLVRFASGLYLPPSLQYFHYRRLFSPDDLTKLLTNDFADSEDLDDSQQWFCELYERENLPDELTRAQWHDLATYLPDDLLVKADRASMAVSLELRAPMLDHGVANLGLSLPATMKVRRGYGKAVLRDAFGDLLPPEVFKGPKRGFGVPVSDWLRVDLRTTLVETLMDPGFLGGGIFNPSAIGGLINDHLRHENDHGHRLWALLILAHWLNRQQ